MIPLKVSWWRSSARCRVCHAWIVVQLGLHRRAPARIRRKLAKAADWLDTTVELMATGHELHTTHQQSEHRENNVASSLAQLYLDLQQEMTGLHRRGRVIKEDIATLRSRVLTLLDTCGLKDGHVPNFHLEPTPVRYADPRRALISDVMSGYKPGARQTSASSSAAAAAAVTPTSHVTPHRPTRARGGGRHPDRRPRDTASYADMLIEQLLAAHANSPLTDSDTSPPSAEDAAAHAMAVMDGTPHTNPGVKENNNNDDKILPMQLHFPSPSPVSASERDACRAPDTAPDPPQGTAPQAAGNTTTGSTPELPTSESSDSLDIPFASLFDQIEDQDIPTVAVGPNQNASLEFDLSMHPDSPNVPSAAYYSFPVHYSHSYARELQKIESGPAANIAQPEPPAACTPGSESKARTCVNKDSSHFVFSEPLVVSLPPLSHRTKLDKSDHNINKNYKPHLGNKTAHFDAEETDDSLFLRPPIPPRRPLTDSKVGKFVVRSSHAEVGSLWVASDSSPLVARAVSDEAVQRSGPHSSRPGQLTSKPGCSSPSSNTSWSFNDITGPNSVPVDPALTMSTGRAYWKEKNSGSRGFVTARPCDQIRVKDTKEDSGGMLTNSASKRRKFNDKMAHPVPVRDSDKGDTASPKSARQRLFRTPSSSPATHSDNLDHSGAGNRMRRKKRQSPAMRRLSQEKENNALSPALESKSPRRPLTDLYNIRLNESDLLTTSSNSLTQSSEAYAKSSETSPDVPLISREEELLDRDAYYCDFTLDRQNKIDAMSARKLQPFKTSFSTEEKKYILRDPATREILVRTVEGAESSPTSFAFQVPPSSAKSSKSVTATPRARPVSSQDCDSYSSTPKTHGASWRSSRKNSYNISNKENRRSPSTSQRSSASSRSSSRHGSPQRTRSSSSRSSRSQSRKTCTTHPMASSTFIMEADSTSPEAEAESESIYYWSIDEDASSCNLEKSYIRSTSSKKKQKMKNNKNIPRPPTSVGRDSPRKEFDITAMVNRFDAALNHKQGEQSTMDLTTQGMHTMCRGNSSKHILAAAPSFVRSINASKVTTTQDSEAFSNISSCQATTSSMFFNRAKASIQCSSNEGSQVSNLRHLSQNSSSQVRQISASEPNLRLRCRNLAEDDASHSLVPSDTDTTPESSELEERPAIPGKSSSSGSSTYTAARCRPRAWRRSPAKALPEVTSEEASSAVAPVAPEVMSGGSPEHVPEGETDQATAQRNQDLLDSILTDSPKSVDSSGIFAPYNSYNSPVESVGSHNGYSSTVSSSVTSSDTNYNYNIYNKSRAAGCTAPPPTPPHTRSDCRTEEQETTSTVGETAGDTTSSTFIGKAVLATARSTKDEGEFKKPFAPAPHVNLTLRPHTRNQGVTAEAGSASASSSTAATPRRPMSVRSDPLANQSVFAVPPGVHTGPPKIKDKKSLVRKFKKFSSHFYKKEKIQTLANL